MTYIKLSIPRPAGNPGIGIQPRDSITILDVDDILYMPPTDDKGVMIVEDIIPKPGAYAYTVYMTPGTIDIASNADGDTDKIGFKPTVKGEHPGNEQEVREFKANSINRRFIVIVRYCSGKPADLIGSICNPCKFTPSYTGNNEGNTNEFTFEQVMKGDDIKIYKGSIPTEQPVTIVEAGAKSVQFLTEGQYQLSSGAAAIDEIEGGSHGALITLVGCTGTAPTVVATPGKILLRDGKTFTASEGSQITLRAFSTGEGEIVWIEQSRFEAV